MNTLKTKVNNLKKKIPDATTLTYKNQYNIDKQNLEKKNEDADKKNTTYKWFSDYSCSKYKIWRGWEKNIRY